MQSELSSNLPSKSINLGFFLFCVIFGSVFFDRFLQNKSLGNVQKTQQEKTVIFRPEIELKI
jgi:hypothetical protein